MKGMEIYMKKLGFGTMRLPVDGKGNIDYELVSRMVDVFISNEFAYFDTAYGYMGKQAEGVLKKCLVNRYSREKYIIADKLTLSKIDDFNSMEDYFSAQLGNLGVEFIDIYLIHGLDAKKYECAKEKGCFNFISELKKRGKVRYTGISFHDSAEVLEKILIEQNDIDYVQLQVNYLDWMDNLVQSKKCVDIAAKYYKRIVVMEPLKGGALASFDEMDSEVVKKMDKEMSPASWGIRFAASQKNVDFVLSGMNTLDQVNDNVSYMTKFVPLTMQEIDLLFRMVEQYKEKKYIQCTECRYCIGVCPESINIPIYIQMLNNIKRFDNKSIFFNLKTYYKAFVESDKGPVECIRCGKCEEICPQKITIRKYLNTVKQLFK